MNYGKFNQKGRFIQYPNESHYGSYTRTPKEV